MKPRIRARRKSITAAVFRGIALLHLTAATSCQSKPDPEIRAEPAPSATPELTLAKFDFHVPAHRTYLQETRDYRGRKRTTSVEEDFVSTPTEQGLGFRNVYRELVPPNSTGGIREWRLDSRGFVKISEHLWYEWKEDSDKTFDPPLVSLPATLTAGATWAHRPDPDTTATLTLRLRSSFCTDGLLTETHSDSRLGGQSIVRNHYCPGQGWRGREGYHIDIRGKPHWSWTTDLVADGQRLDEPPLSERFPEGPPPL